MTSTVFVFTKTFKDSQRKLLWLAPEPNIICLEGWYVCCFSQRHCTHEWIQVKLWEQMSQGPTHCRSAGQALSKGRHQAAPCKSGVQIVHFFLFHLGKRGVKL
jgi:hypothetical protein